MKGFFDTEKYKETTTNKGKPSCAGCGLYKGAKNPYLTEPYGEGKRGIMIVGEAPGGTEDARGKPWQGKAGNVLKRTLKSHGINLFEDCWSINSVNCRPVSKTGANRTPTNNEINCCRRFVIDAIRRYEPHIILLAGGTALHPVIAHRWQKDFGGIMKWRGWQIPDQDFNAWICPIYHPSYIMRKKGFNEVETIWNSDIYNALNKLSVDVPDNTPPEVEMCESPKEVDNALKEVQTWGEFAFDIETSGLKPHDKDNHEIHVISFSNGKKTFTLQIYPYFEQNLSQLKKLLENKASKIAHNMKYEHKWIQNICDFEVQNWAWDTLILAHMLDNRTGVANLKFQTYVQLGIIGYESEVDKYLKSPSANQRNKVDKAMKNSILRHEMLKYCGLDSLFTKWIKDKIVAHKGIDMNAYQLFHEGTFALHRAEEQGMRIDINYVQRKQKQTDRKIRRIERDLMKTNLMQEWQRIYGAKFNYNSNDQLKYMLFTHRGLTPIKKTPAGQGSVDEESLKQLNLDETNAILRIRKLKKLRSTYLDNFYNQQVHGIMHPFFGLTGTKTFRGNSNEPNFQNIPKRDKEAMKLTRSAIYPRENHQLIEFDFSKLEVSIAACYHKDPVMMKYLTSEHNDMHGDVAAQVFVINDFDKSKYDYLRQAAKNGFVFPQFYGDWFMGNAESLRQWAGLPTGKWKKSDGIEMDLPDGKTVGEHLINNGIKEFGKFDKNRSTGFIEHLRQIEDDFWNNRFKVYQQWKERWVKKYQKRGWFKMLTGFICRGEMRRNEVINYPVQGAAFHCLLWTLIRMDEFIHENNYDSRIIGQIHDAIVMDVNPDESEIIARKMKEIAEQQLPEAWDWIKTPLQIEAEICPVDGSWAQKEDWKWFNNL